MRSRGRNQHPDVVKLSIRDASGLFDSFTLTDRQLLIAHQILKK